MDRQIGQDEAGEGSDILKNNILQFHSRHPPLGASLSTRRETRNLKVLPLRLASLIFHGLRRRQTRRRRPTEGGGDFFKRQEILIFIKTELFHRMVDSLPPFHLLLFSKATLS